MQANSRRKYSTSICHFESVERKGKLTKIWISRERKELFRRNKKNSVWRAIIWKWKEKKGNFIKKRTQVLTVETLEQGVRYVQR